MPSASVTCGLLFLLELRWCCAELSAAHVSATVPSARRCEEAETSPLDHSKKDVVTPAMCLKFNRLAFFPQVPHHLKHSIQIGGPKPERRHAHRSQAMAPNASRSASSFPSASRPSVAEVDLERLRRKFRQLSKASKGRFYGVQPEVQT